MRMTEPCQNSNQHQWPFNLRVVMLAVAGCLLLPTMDLADKPEEKKPHPHRGVRKFAVEKDVHGFLFKAAKANGKVKSRSSEQGWIDKGKGEEASVAYQDTASNDVEVVIQQIYQPEFVAHELEGEFWNVPRKIDASIQDYKDQPVLVFKSEKMNQITVCWCNAEVIVRITRTGSTDLPADLLDAYLKELPSDLRKGGIYKSRKEWKAVDKQFKANMK